MYEATFFFFILIIKEMNRIGILSIYLFVFTSGQIPTVTQLQTPPVISRPAKTESFQNEKKENERIKSPFNVINTRYEVMPLRVKVYNWLTSWFSPRPFY